VRENLPGMKRLKFAICSVLALMAAPAAAHAADNVGVPHSGWFWGNPQPQGSTLNDVSFAGGTGYAAGNFGTLLKTVNGGLSWKALPADAGGTLNRVRAVDANVLLAGGGCVLRRSDDGGATFARIAAVKSERRCSSTVASFGFSDATSGYVLLSSGAVERTSDGGQTFAAGTPLPGTTAAGAATPARPSDIWALSSTTVVALAGGTILRSTDGGVSWNSAFSGGQPLNGVYFASAAIGYAAGDGKTLLRTADGGVTWTPLAVPADLPAADLTSVHCAPGAPNLCLVATRQGDQLLRTTDGGATITPVAPYAGRKILAAAFGSAGSATAVGQNGATSISGDGGQNWAPVGGSLGPSLSRLRSVPSGSVFAAGAGGTLLRTLNGGADWASRGVTTADAVSDVSFPSDSVGFALDSSGAVFKTLDGGTHWAPLGSGSVPRARAIYAPDARTVLAFGPDGIARSLDGGAFDAEGGEESVKPVLSGYDRFTGGLVLYGARSLVLADTTVTKLKRVARPGGSKARIRSADFLSTKRGFVLNRDGRVWLTKNGGRKWSEIRTTGTARANAMAWADAKDGYLAVDRLASEKAAGYVLRTSDGGHTWRPQLVAPAPLRSDGLVATGSGHALALADGNQLFYTDSGGDAGDASTLTIKSSALRIKRATTLKISGRIAPAAAGATVYVSARPLHGGSWTTKVSGATGAAGRFSVKIKVSQSSVVVARWLGNGELAGDGSNVLAVRRLRR
jgi:photosystem II stability/assembly factor-like uncharacterized protein